MEIHIMSIGTNIGHAQTALRKFNYDKVYFIVGKPVKNEKRNEFLKKYRTSNDNAAGLKKHVEDGGGEAEIVKVPVFNKDSLNLLLEEYKKIIEDEVGNNIHINITGGTNLMGAAALSAAYFNSVSAYYVLDPNFSDSKETILNLPIPKIVYTNALTTKQKFVLKKIGEKKHLSRMGELVDKKEIKSIQALKPHIDALDKMGLIKINKESKRYEIEPSESGKIIIGMLK
jgi:hypothetical protein